MTTPPHLSGGYTCVGCGIFVPFGDAHTCPAWTTTSSYWPSPPPDPMAANTAAIRDLAAAIRELAKPRSCTHDWQPAGEHLRRCRLCMAERCLPHDWRVISATYATHRDTTFILQGCQTCHQLRITAKPGYAFTWANKQPQVNWEEW